MKKVNVVGVVGVDEMIEKVKGEIEYLNNGYEWNDIKEVVLKNGSGVYEFVFGCRGGLEDFVKNNEYMSVEDLMKNSGESIEELMESYEVESVEELKMIIEEYYNDEDNFVLSEENFVKCVSYYDEDWSLFVNVKV